MPWNNNIAGRATGFCALSEEKNKKKKKHQKKKEKWQRDLDKDIEAEDKEDLKEEAELSAEDIPDYHEPHSSKEMFQTPRQCPMNKDTGKRECPKCPVNHKPSVGRM